jgi:tyrosinase-like protein
MFLSRRSLIAALPQFLAFGDRILFGGQSALAQPGPAPRMKLEDFVKDQKRVQSLKRGVQVMKDRSPSDPKSWFFQAAVHAVSNDFLQDALQRDPKVAQVDQQKFWNQCPHFGKPSAEFVLWHRAYVFYFERILRDAAQDPTLSLPYWNYTDATQRGFPALFGKPEFDAAGKPTNPLFDARREIAFVQGKYDLNNKTVSTEAAFGSNEFFGLDEISGFAGGIADTDPQTKGLIEQSPHDNIHLAVGGTIPSGLTPFPPGATVGLMTIPETSAFDPVFWIHHSNVERLWTVWDCLKDRAWGTVPAEAWLRDKPWWFNDYDGKVVNESRLHYLSADLGVRYDSDDPACKPFSRTPPIPDVVAEVSRPDARTIAKTLAFTTEVARQELGRNNSQVTLSPNKRTSQSVSLANKALPGAGALKSLLASTPLLQRRVLLEIEDVDYETPPSVGYEVYVNLPRDAVADSASPNFVGTLALFGIKHDASGHAHGKSVQQFDITRVVNQLPDPSQITVSLVPFDLLKPKGDAPPLRREAGVTIGAMRVIVVESKPSLQ